MPELDGGSGGIFFSDPTLFPLYSCDAGGILGALSSAVSTAAGFFTGSSDSADRLGADIDSNWTANTFKTLLNLTATKAGFVSAIMGPTLATAADTCIFEITVDGALYTLTAGTAQANTSRIFLAAPMRQAGFTSAGSYQIASLGAPTDGVTFGSSSTTVAFYPPQVAWIMGAPMLRFTSTLLIRAKTSQNITATGSQERRAAIYYARTA